jgi:hypothetical protein
MSRGSGKRGVISDVAGADVGGSPGIAPGRGAGDEPGAAAAELCNPTGLIVMPIGFVVGDVARGAEGNVAGTGVGANGGGTTPLVLGTPWNDNPGGPPAWAACTFPHKANRLAEQSTMNHGNLIPSPPQWHKGSLD